jgi:hypothetical protein
MVIPGTCQSLWGVWLLADLALSLWDYLWSQLPGTMTSSLFSISDSRQK